MSDSENPHRCSEIPLDLKSPENYVNPAWAEAEEPSLSELKIQLSDARQCEAGAYRMLQAFGKQSETLDCILNEAGILGEEFEDGGGYPVAIPLPDRLKLLVAERDNLIAEKDRFRGYVTEQQERALKAEAERDALIDAAQHGVPICCSKPMLCISGSGEPDDLPHWSCPTCEAVIPNEPTCTEWADLVQKLRTELAEALFAASQIPETEAHRRLESCYAQLVRIEAEIGPEAIKDASWKVTEKMRQGLYAEAGANIVAAIQGIRAENDLNRRFLSEDGFQRRCRMERDEKQITALTAEREKQARFNIKERSRLTDERNRFEVEVDELMDRNVNLISKIEDLGVERDAARRMAGEQWQGRLACLVQMGWDSDQEAEMISERYQLRADLAQAREESYNQDRALAILAKRIVELISWQKRAVEELRDHQVNCSMFYDRCSRCSANGDCGNFKLLQEVSEEVSRG